MLPACTGAFVAGLLLGSYLPFFPFLTVSFLIVLTVVVSRRESAHTMSSCGGTGWYAVFMAGLLYWHAYGLIVPWTADIDDDGRRSRLYTGTVVEPVQHASDRVTMIVQLEPAAHVPYATRVKLTWRDADISLRRGDRLAFQADLRPPHGPLNPRGFDYASYLKRQGIGALATVSGRPGLQVVASGERSWRWGFWFRVDQWREQIRIAAVHSLNQPALGLFLSLIIGERGYLTAEVQDWFMVTGTIHILSISGSHLGFVALVSFGVCRRLLLALPWPWLLTLSRRTTPTRLAALWTLFPVMTYALLAGAETATMRSLLMVTIGLMALWWGYRRRLLHALSLAAIAILVHDPRAMYDISFQLSFLSVWSIAWLVERSGLEEQARSSWIGVGIRRLRESLAISSVVTLATLPLVAFYFNQLPWIGLLMNLLIVPIVGLLLVPIGLGAACWVIATGSDQLPIGIIVDSLHTAVVHVVRCVATLLHVRLSVAAPTVPMIGLFYWLCHRAVMKPGHRAIRAAALGGMAILIAWWAWSPRLFDPSGATLRVTFLDVGQGDSAVVELPDEAVMVIDGGAASQHFDMGRSVVAPYLWNRGIRRLDHVVGTHPQLDHVGGLASVIDLFPVGHVWTNGIVREEMFWQRLERSLYQKSLYPETARRGTVLWAGRGCRMEVLGPDTTVAVRYADQRAASPRELNDSSIVLDLRCGARSFLFAADLERPGLTSLLNDSPVSHVTVLKVPHHGARSSLDLRWVASIHPEVAVFSVGAHNPYRHPAQVVVEAYEQVHALIARTDRDGAVWVELNTGTSEYRVHRVADGLLQAVSWSPSLLAQERANVLRLWHRWNWQ